MFEPLHDRRTQAGRAACATAAALVFITFIPGCRRRTPAGTNASTAALAPSAIPPGTPTLRWTDDAVSFAGRDIGIPQRVYCPPGGTAAPVYGTELYGVRSSICTAAVHARRITLASGGVVIWYGWPQASRLLGVTHYGITSLEALNEFTFTFTPYVPRHFELFLGFGPLPRNARQPSAPRNPLPATPMPPRPQAVESQPLPIGWTTAAQRWRSQIGSIHAVFCGPRPRSLNGIYGTGTYSFDSAICVSALHDGRILPGGGVVTLQMAPGLSRYPSVTRNGVHSEGWGSVPASYTFIGSSIPLPPVIPTTPTLITWSATAEQLRGMEGTEVTFVCPPGDFAQPTYGGGEGTPFADESSICTVGVYAGVVTFPTGGTVRIRIGPRANVYTGGDQNGVTTGLTFGTPGTSSFTVVR